MKQTEKENYHCIVIVGLGLIGGSIALGIRATLPTIHLVGIDISQHNRQAATACCSEVFATLDDLPQHLHSPELVIFATPVLQYPMLAISCKQLFGENTTITDAGSVKNIFFASFSHVYGDNMPKNIIGGHPIAGAEQSGFDAADANLFMGKHFVLVQQDNTTHDVHYRRVVYLWQEILKVGTISYMQVHEHDHLFAYTSHLPHLLSFALVHFMGNLTNHKDLFTYVGAGFRDFTRIASSSPTMWSNITTANTQAIGTAFDGFINELQNLRQLLHKNSSHTETDIRQYLDTAKNIRDTHVLHLHTAMSHTLASSPLTHRVGISGKIHIPGDKSISHRSIIFGAIAQGISYVDHVLDGEDNLATIEAFRDMGVTIKGPTNNALEIHGVGLHGLQPPKKPLYLGNSGTAMRLLCGLLVGQQFTSTLTGDASLSARPMDRILTPLRQMGAKIEATDNTLAPLHIYPTRSLQGICYQLPMASAQVKSAMLLAGLYCKNTTTIIEPLPTRDHSERLLKNMGVAITQKNNTITLTPPTTNVVAGTWQVPSDISSAAFFLVAGCIIPHSKIMIERVGVNPTRIGIITILKRMGANITLTHQRTINGEPVADIIVCTSILTATHIDEKDMALAIDEFPALCIAAACAQGQTRITGAAELRVKESDRIATMVEGLSNLGIKATALPDGANIVGGPISGGRVDSFGDHRIAMAFAIAGSVAKQPIFIKNCANIATSFPTFVQCATHIGLRIQNA